MVTTTTTTNTTTATTTAAATTNATSTSNCYFDDYYYYYYCFQDGQGKLLAAINAGDLDNFWQIWIEVFADGAGKGLWHMQEQFTQERKQVTSSVSQIGKLGIKMKPILGKE